MEAWMPASFFSFTELAQRVQDDAAGKPWPHLVLQIRAHERGGYRAQGDRAFEFGATFARARFAMRTIRAVCARERYTAHVTIYAPDNREVFRVIEIKRP